MAKPLPIAEFADQLNALSEELFTANVHFQIANGLRSAWSEYFSEIQPAYVFWRFTILAHETAAILGLCRVYEDQKGALTLRRFVETVKANPGIFKEPEFRKRLSGENNPNRLASHFTQIDQQQLQEDLRFCTSDPTVQNLLLMRGNVVAHFNYDLATRKAEALSRSVPLPFTDIGKLIDNGFQIVNRYSGHYIAKAFSDRLASRQDQDYLNVLRALREAAQRPVDRLDNH